MEDILCAIEELVEEARISGAHPDEPTNYQEAHAALCSAIRSYGDACAAAERGRINRMLHEHVKSRAQYSPDDATARGRFLEASDIAELVRNEIPPQEHS
jgi:predicted anti-sigma-YlaC factor YlaD